MVAADKLVVGVDEVGYGALAGPVCAGAVVHWKGESISYATDSKKLTESARYRIFDTICSSVIFWSVSFVSPQDIDNIGGNTARLRSMKMVVDLARKYYPDSHIIVDGTSGIPDVADQSAFIKADYKFPSVGAASIIAKVVRDRYMISNSFLFPEYGFESHKGYGTKRHKEAIRKHGLSCLHRRSYCH